MKTHLAKFFALLLILTLMIPACTPQVTAPAPVLLEETATAAPPVTITSTPALRSLNICLGEEPTTLYPYGNLTPSARSVLAAVYDGPMDVRNYIYEPVILEKIPSLADGDAQVSPVTVKAGDKVVDASGNVVTLSNGVRIRPSTCRADDCAVSYNGSSNIQMDQMVATFTLLKDLMWSDGKPLTSADSIYSYQLASDAATPVSKYVIDRTASYEAADDQTVQWWGLPGYIDSDYYTNFWMPLPQHAWSELNATDLLKNEVSSRLPVGWGPYIIDKWEPGKSIHLVKNLNYFLAASGLPKFDELTFLFQPDADAAITDLINGTCDVLDPSVGLDGQVGLLQQMSREGQADLQSAATMTMEWLGFGIVPASYDNGYVAKNNEDRPDIFGDKRTRQAIALCLDRQKMVDTVLYGLSPVPDSYLPADHPLHNGNVQTYTYNPTTGQKILEDVGWEDTDGDPSTPRQSLKVTNVPDGTPLVLKYYTSSATQRVQVADILIRSLTECGIGVDPYFQDAAQFYAQGPAGPLFGRQFDLAEYSIGVNSLEPQCSWFTTSQIPAAKNQWVGTNVTGYSNPSFDSACAKGSQSLSSDPEHNFHQEAQAIFATDLPAIPLYQRIKVAATRPDFCGFTLDPSSPSALENIETFGYGEICKRLLTGTTPTPTIEALSTLPPPTP
jgi:peptide/nickel transport system substrate-binding protein